MKKRVLSLFLAITLCLTLTPTGALAAEGQPPEQTVSVTQEAQIPAPAAEEEEEEKKTTSAENGADENDPPANPEENPTENAPAAAEKNTEDKGTGKVQSIRIEASSGLSDDEVKRMKEEAQANAEADKKEKERIDKLNQADSMIFQTEKQLKDLGDKLPADKKAPIETALNKLKEAHKAQDIAGIDAAMAELNSVFQAASQEMYNAQNAQGGAQPGPDFGQQTGGNAGNNKQDGGVTDVDFEEVK